MTDTSDMTGFALDLSAGLDLHFGDLKRELRGMREALELKLAVPRFSKIALPAVGGGSQAYPASGNLTLGGIGPEASRVWVVRTLTVGGLSVTTSPNGTAWLFGGKRVPADTLVTETIGGSLTTFPNSKTYGTNQCVLNPGDNLWVVITGGTATTVYTAAVFIEEWEERAYKAQFERK